MNTKKKVLRLDWLGNPGTIERLVSGECEFNVRCQDILLEIELVDVDSSLKEHDGSKFCVPTELLEICEVNMCSTGSALRITIFLN